MFGENVIVMGVDYSTKAIHTATFIDGELFSIASVTFPAYPDFAKRLATRGDIEPVYHYGKQLVTDSPENDIWVAIEGYIAMFDRQGKMAALHWMLRADTITIGRKSLVVPPSQWKRQIGLAGNANKGQIKEHVLALYPDLYKHMEQDCYDAVGIARAAWQTLHIEKEPAGE